MARRTLLLAPKRLKVEEIPSPQPDRESIVIQIAGCAVCGTDVKKYFKGHSLIKKYPITTGHELSGTIVSVGENVREVVLDVEGRRDVRNYNVGDCVVIAPVVACERCPNCISGRPEYCKNRQDVGFNFDGGFAEYMIVPSEIIKKKINAIIPVPKDVALFKAVLAEPYGCAIHAQEKILRPEKWERNSGKYAITTGIVPEDTVLVIGGGPLGCIHAELAKRKGSRVILTQRSEAKLENDRRIGVADYYLNNTDEKRFLSQIMDLTKGAGVDVTITAASTESAQVLSAKATRQGGFISFFGGVPKDSVDFPTNLLHYNGPLVGGTSGASPYHIAMSLDYMKDGTTNPVRYITHLFSLNFLEKLLITKGVPLLMSFEEVKNEKGVEFFDFVEGSESCLDALKDSIMKAVCVPKMTDTEILTLPQELKKREVFLEKVFC